MTIVDSSAAASLATMQADLGVAGSPRMVAPRDVAECASLLREASAEHRAVAPWGGGTQQALGAPPSRCDIILSLGELSGVESYRPEDLTLGVRAGTTLAELAAHLAGHGQFLPLDAARPQSATIGGIVATAFAPVRRFRYGSVRDAVIGVEVAMANGALCKGGGRVVKNVAGYDLCKLFTGSLGTLGVIVGVHFKVQPRPSVQVAITGAFAGFEAAFEAARALARRSLCLSAAVVEGPDRWRVILVAEGFRGAVDRQVAEARRLIAEREGEAERAEDPAVVTRMLQDLAARRAIPAGSGAVLARGSVAPARLQAALPALLRAAERAFEAAYVQCDVAVGTFYVTLHPRARDSDEAGEQASSLARARLVLRELGGHIVVEAAPAALRRRFDPWGAPADGERLARSLKAQLDPDGILNPGRFAYGI